MSIKTRKIFLSLVTGIVLLSQTLGYAAPVRAQAVVGVIADIPRTVDTVLAKVFEGLKIAALNVASTAISYALRKISYDAAVWIASGGKGQGALVYNKDFGDYLKDVADDTAGHALDALGKDFGVNLCRISDPQIDLAFRINLRSRYTSAPTKPSCTIKEFYTNNLTEEAWRSRFDNLGKSITSKFNEALTFDFSDGDLGLALTSYTKINEQIEAKTTAAASARLEGNGLRPMVDQVSGRIKTPAALVEAELQGVSNQSRVNQSADQINTVIASGNWQLLPGALANFFLNTLAGNMIKNFQEQGILPFGICIGDKGGPDCAGGGTSSGSFSSSPGGQFTGRQAAQALFSDFLTVRITQVDQYDLLSQLSSCPQSGVSMYNCRADNGLIQAAQESNNGNPLTIKEAIEKGFVRGDWKLIPPESAINAARDCHARAYCYSNVKVLRQTRLLPIGFEIAAERSNPDQPWSLAQVIAGFNDCDFVRDGSGKVTGVNYDPINKPFCHLIDPNWILKIPDARCSADAYGSSLLSTDVPDRAKTCTDLSTCVAYNKDGSCVNYAYCAREQNTWKFDADKCDAEYRTCRTFTDSQNIKKSYVLRSVNTAYCNKDTVGCKAYSLDQDSSGSWKTGSGVSSVNTNLGIHFNGTASLSCGARSAGCSAFSVALSPETLLYLRKAPDYLKCYDSNPSTPEIEYPKTRADLERIQARPECRDYAGICIQDEMNCNWYTPKSGGQAIPGKYDATNVCDARCVGYGSYREMPNNYSNGQELAYIIPSSGQACRESEEGCSAFTNLSVTAGGGEQVEYFSYLRPCAQPDQNTQKNFTTYEGSVTGFQLKTYTLIKDSSGAPKYFYRTADDLAQYNAICNQTLYKAGAASLDCREFNDENGAVYYRLLSKTIPVTAQCTPYRLTNAELYQTALTEAECRVQKGYFNGGKCSLCFQGGEYRDGSCFYYGLPEGQETTAGKSVSCLAQVDTCHAYKGNAGNNVRNIFNDSFEVTTVPAEWKGSGLAITNESVRFGGKSLGFTGNGSFYREFIATPGRSQEVTLWAKGTAQTITVSLQSADGRFSKDFGQITIGDVWNQYRLGPIDFGELATSSARLVVKSSVTGRLYFDAIEIKEVSDYIYLVKKTLKVDGVCDSNLNDNLPGEALGCSAYTDPNKNTVNLTGFSYLCRENAIGCTAVLDTYNTLQDTKPRAYNIRLSGAAGSTVSATVGADTVSCVVPGGETGCFVNIFGHDAKELRSIAGISFSASTVYIPGDTPSSTPLFLVANQSATCNAADLGCMYAGIETQTPTGPKYQTTLVKNDPAGYEKTLCQKEAIGCQAYTTTDGTAYFKDPAVVGNKVCSYRTNITVNGVKSDGWFWNGVGVCSNDAKKYCSLDQDCGAGNVCRGVGDQPCYPTYVINGNNYGLWSAGDGAKYENFVGECPEKQNMCTEFIDHADQDRRYYLIKNSKINAGSCDGKVSQRAGCALFDQADQPNKFYNSKATYDLSTANQFDLVAPVQSTPAAVNDSNIIIQVKRDRQCSEWLQCRSSHRVWDEANQRWKTVCDAIGRCDRAPENAQEDTISNCANWVEDDPLNPPRVLTAEQYVKRDVSWSGKEYSGFSILNMFPIESLSQIDISATSSSREDWRLVRTVACGGVNCANPAFPNEVRCQTNNAPCGRGSQGLCVSGACMQGIDGTNKNVIAQARAQTCRAYPEKDSPFPNSPFILEKAISQFSRANVCNETDKQNIDPAKSGACDCDYTKVTYGNVFTKYFAYTNPHNTEEVIKGGKGVGTVPEGICLGGSQDGRSCANDLDCFKTTDGKPYDSVLKNDAKDGPGGSRISDGSCQKQKSNYKLLGWRGYCLEQDTSRAINGNVNEHPCLTWLPIDHLVGTQDINNQHTEAGYNPPALSGGAGGALYCLEGNSAGGDSSAPVDFYPKSRTVQAGGVTINVDGLIELPAGTSAGNGQFARRSFNPVASASKVTMLDIERIDFKVTDSARVDPIGGTVFSIWPNASGVTSDKAQAVYRTKGHMNGRGRALTGKYLGKDTEFVLLYGSGVNSDGGNPLDSDKVTSYVNEDGGICYPRAKYNDLNFTVDDSKCQGLSGNIFKKLYTNFTTDLGSQGLWNNAYSTSEICQAYTPKLVGKEISWQGNWHAVRVRFNPTTKLFEGYDIVYCKQDQNFLGNEFGKITYQVTFKLRQWCRAVADTGSNLELAQGSAAWTNRLYRNSGFQVQYFDPALGTVGPKYIYADDQSPFGSLSISAFPSLRDAVLLTNREQIGQCEGSCSDGGLYQRKLDATIATEQKFETPSLGAPYSCVDGSCVRKTATGEVTAPSAVWNTTKSQGFSNLNTLFARVNTVYNYLMTGSGSSDRPTGYIDTFTKSDITETANEIPKPPFVFPIASCDAGNKCLEDASAVGFTVNSQSKGNVTFYTPSARAFIKFFMLADHNQMPVRRVTMDWGDGYQYPLNGLFQNHRGARQSVCRIPSGAASGVCEVAELDDESSCRADAECGLNGKCVRTGAGSTIGKCLRNRATGITCQSDVQCPRVDTCQEEGSAKSFGKIKGKTCSPDYVQFDHVYQCYRGQPGVYFNSREQCGGDMDECCVYVPKIQVKDNWGWCSGSCPGGAGGDGCYEKADGGECSSKGSFIPFDGKIIVRPKG
jgi:hypothetical protein